MGNVNAIAAFYERLNINLDNLDNRKILQKKIYFLQEFGFNLGYHFGFYIYGPYSTELTSNVFNLQEQIEVARNTVVRERLNAEQREYLHILDEFLEGIPEDELANQLELLSSVHFLNNHIFQPVRSAERMIQEIEERKPGRFNPQSIREAWDRLLDLDMIQTEESVSG